jgi:hypothetical protein
MISLGVGFILESPNFFIMAKKKKESIIMCGGCYNDFIEDQIKMGTMNINPSGPGNGVYARNLCPKCLESPYYKSRVLYTEVYRKFN